MSPGPLAIPFDTMTNNADNVSVMPVKKVFVTAHKQTATKTTTTKEENDKFIAGEKDVIKHRTKKPVEKSQEPQEPKTSTNANEPKKPRNKKKKETLSDSGAKDNTQEHAIISQAQSPAEHVDGNVDMKKKPRKRNKKKPFEDNDTEELTDKVQEMSLKSSPGLSVEAAPFVPGSPANKTLKHVVNPERKPVSRPKPKVKADADLRSVEVDQLRIRFAPTGFTQNTSSDDGAVILQCVMPITDPDFAYDLASIRIEMVLPRGYPGSKSAPIRPTFTILNSDLPASICSGIERNMKWGLNSLEGGVLVCRPMLRYLEDNLEKWMVESVRESAFKFVKPSEIKISEKPAEDEGDNDSSDSSESEIISSTKTSTAHSIQNTQNSSNRISQGDWLAPAPITDQSSVGGSGYTLKLFFSCIRGIDLLTSQNLSFLACCDRCKFNFPVEALRPYVDRIEHCPKCTNQTKFYYKAQLVTPGANFEDDEEYEGVLGSIRFLRAKPVDLLSSLYQCACSRCYGSETDDHSGNLSSSCKIEKVKIGEVIGYGCFNCHQKLRFQIDRIEWLPELVGGTVSKQQKTNNNKTKSGPTLTVGSPLPQNGACEHYKKSFRWYRFPCCGQAFPCDECHAKDPIAKDHPVEWANRFICGYCSREQSISIKECPECGKDTSAAGRRKSPFWEGGKGTRNQVLMSRKDSKKYKDYSLNSSSTVKAAKKKKATDSS